MSLICGSILFPRVSRKCGITWAEPCCPGLGCVFPEGIRYLGSTVKDAAPPAPRSPRHGCTHLDLGKSLLSHRVDPASHCIHTLGPLYRGPLLCTQGEPVYRGPFHSYSGWTGPKRLSTPRSVTHTIARQATGTCPPATRLLTGTLTHNPRLSPLTNDKVLRLPEWELLDVTYIFF